MRIIFSIFGLLLIASSCKESPIIEEVFSSQNIVETFGSTINPNALFDYEGQKIPNYIRKDNSGQNFITNEGATLGRVLFYDKALSVSKTISCASCHQQQFAFSDTSIVSNGVNGKTARHSMRLINTRFAEETRFFWDERAASLEEQTIQPIQDHIEMGFSGENGALNLNDLIERLGAIRYYSELFTMVYGDSVITEERIQLALAQFIRSIQSFDSKFDAGMAVTNNFDSDFPNFTEQENLGKLLFLGSPRNGGAGCQSCHVAPEFDISPISRNNGVIGVANTAGTDLTIAKAPTLRALFNHEGLINGPLMHDASLSSVLEVINHYNLITVTNDNLDNRLKTGENGLQNLNLSEEEKLALVAFIKTLSGTAVYTAEQWSDPF